MMKDFKNKYFVDALLAGLIILSGIFFSKNHSIETSVLGSMSILLCCIMVVTTLNLKARITRTKEILSRNKQKAYIYAFIIIVVGMLIVDSERVVPALLLPVALSVAVLLNSLLFKEKSE